MCRLCSDGAYGEAFALICVTSGPEASGDRHEGDLPGGDTRRGRTSARQVRLGMGRAVPADSEELAGELGADCADVRLPCGSEAGHLHNEYDRVIEHDIA